MPPNGCVSQAPHHPQKQPDSVGLESGFGCLLSYNFHFNYFKMELLCGPLALRGFDLDPSSPWSCWVGRCFSCLVWLPLVPD